MGLLPEVKPVVSANPGRGPLLPTGTWKLKFRYGSAVLAVDTEAARMGLTGAAAGVASTPTAHARPLAPSTAYKSSQWPNALDWSEFFI